MANSRNDKKDEEAYEIARREHLKSIVVAYSSRRSNREPPHILSKSGSFFQQQEPLPTNVQAQDDTEEKARCFPWCKKK